MRMYGVQASPTIPSQCEPLPFPGADMWQVDRVGAVAVQGAHHLQTWGWSTCLSPCSPYRVMCWHLSFDEFVFPKKMLSSCLRSVFLSCVYISRLSTNNHLLGSSVENIDLFLKHAWYLIENVFFKNICLCRNHLNGGPLAAHAHQESTSRVGKHNRKESPTMISRLAVEWKYR